jgi:hypothetical protein
VIYQVLMVSLVLKAKFSGLNEAKGYTKKMSRLCWKLGAGAKRMVICYHY